MALRVVRRFGCAIATSIVLLAASIQDARSDETTTAGLHDLVILDPGAHERGLPAVELKYLDGGQQIDIPPKVHVHRYYYSGDKLFQGPILQGGPTVVVASHPKTGERLYIDVVLPAGAPRIQHRKNSISYIYNDKRVEIRFRHFPFDPSVALVKHHSGKGVARTVHDAREHVHEKVQDTLTNSPMVNSIKNVGSEGKDLVCGVGTMLGEFSTKGADSFKLLSNMIPGVTYLKSLSDQRPQQQYESTIRRAETKAASIADPFVRTNR